MAVGFEDRRELAKRVLELIELTFLADHCTEEDVRALCRRARTPHGDVAAVCVPAKFVSVARDALKGSRIAVSTVANWPRGRSKVDYVAAEAEIAFFEGADEVNVVMPWRQVIQREERTPASMMEECARMAGRRQFIKATLEAGKLDDEFLVRDATRVAIDNGAEFIETESGKTDARCSLAHARMILEEIRNHHRDSGFKAGNVESLDEAREYLELIAEVMGEDWVNPDNVRLGGNRLLDEVLAVLDEARAA
jgi:deoxyribose-phosphate aldolase